MVSLFGTNAACEVPLPVIFTSTTAAACSTVGATGVVAVAAAGGGAGAAWASDAAAAFLSPQAAAPEATRAGSHMERLARFLRGDDERALVDAFTIYPSDRKTGDLATRAPWCAFAGRRR